MRGVLALMAADKNIIEIQSKTHPENRMTIHKTMLDSYEKRGWEKATAPAPSGDDGDPAAPGGGDPAASESAPPPEATDSGAGATSTTNTTKKG